MAGREKTVSDEEILQLFRESPDPVLTTSEVAEEFDFSNAGAGKRLKELVREGRLDMKRAGRNPVYWLDESDERDN